MGRGIDASKAGSATAGAVPFASTSWPTALWMSFRDCGLDESAVVSRAEGRASDETRS
jgi:hypothetical protein